MTIFEDDRRTFGDVMADPRTVGEAAMSLWVALQDAGGDQAEVGRLLQAGAQSMPADTFSRVAAGALALTYAKTWPAVLRICEEVGVSEQELSVRLTAELLTEYGEALRADVTVEEATSA